MKKIAIIGGGVVGSVCGFYLSRDGYDVTLYDEGVGQATKAAVGIICPWVSQRRNKWWYGLVDDGSKFYHQLISDVNDCSFYEPSGALLSNDKRLDAMLELALERRKDNEFMGKVEIVRGSQLESMLPEGAICSKALYIEGAARVDGALLVKTLQEESMAQGLKRIVDKVSFDVVSDGYKIGDVIYDALVLSCGAWLGEVLPNHSVDVRPQKGELIEFTQHVAANQYPLFIPKGEIDLLYKHDGSVVVGASHEDEVGFDMKPNPKVLHSLQEMGGEHLPSLLNVAFDKSRLGIRAYSSDFLPFYGGVDGLENVYAASGLGSSGLTSGPIIGYRLYKQVIGQESTSSTSNYIRPLR